MQLPINTFKAALEQDQVQIGFWLALPHSSCAEIAAGAGFDWLLIDCEHAPYSLIDVQHHLQAIAPYNVPAIVRPVEGRTAILKQYLDIGVQNFLVPMVDTPEQAQQLAKDVRYPPEGIRGLGTSMARAAHWNGIPNYIQTANQEICLIVQAETETAIKNLGETSKVDGVDAIFIGPSDLSASMGFAGQPDHPEVVAMVEQGIRTIRAAGKPAGVLAVTPELVATYKKAGANFIAVGVDVSLLAASARQLAAKYSENSGIGSNTAGY